MSRLDSVERLAALERSGLLRKAIREQMVQICYTVTQLLQVDASQLNVVSDDQQIFIAEWPRAMRPPEPITNSGCREVVLSDATLAVDDTLRHPVMCTMPWTANWQGYLGAPLRYDGQVLGALCALTVSRRAWSAQDRLTVEALCSLASTAIVEYRKVADPTDPD